MSATLQARLERLYAETDTTARLAADPVAFPRRYGEPADQEVAGLLAAGLAYGRVAAFRPVLERIFALADAAGGPRAWVEGFDPARDGAALAPLVYRWNRGPDWILLLAVLRRVIEERGGLEALLPSELPLAAALDAAVTELRDHAVALAPSCGLDAERFADLPRGFRYFLPRPSDGSACKRWSMYLRWMVRPPTEGIDLGLWRSRSPSELVVPLDTHVLRIARFLGLTRRSDGSWRTALEVTEALRAFDPDDPVRFDFALAHLGISGACRGHRHPEACPGCPLDEVCAA